MHNFHKTLTIKAFVDILWVERRMINPIWGEVMRAGSEQSRFAYQVEKYACVYMSKIADFAEYSSKKYFRPKRRQLPHEEIQGRP